MCVLVLEFPADQLTEKPATPVILAAQEVKIRRIMVQIQSRANSLRDPIPGKAHHKKGIGGVAQGEDPGFKLQYHKKKGKKKNQTASSVFFHFLVL
jgi:hypothetical protein